VGCFGVVVWVGVWDLLWGRSVKADRAVGPLFWVMLVGFMHVLLRVRRFLAIL